jgi:CRP/FNR family transcriptional regulator, dissimilatory nitrate respiration regulator
MPCPCRPLCFAPKPDCHPEASARGRTLAEAVQAMPLFAGLDGKVMQRLMADAQPVDVSRGALLFTAGTEADCFYVVLTGQVKLFALLPDGRESIIEVIRPVTSFGEAAMLGGRSFPVNAEVIDDGTLVRVGRRTFMQALHSDHNVGYRILAALCAWNQRLACESQLLRGQQAWQRVAEYLLTLAPPGAEAASFRLPYSKEVLASRLGIRRESLSRVFSRLRPLGVETSGATVRIADLGALRFACDSGAISAAG